MVKINNIPLLISGFVILIVGIIILLHGIFNMMPENPTNETISLWLVVLVIGVLLTLGSLVAIDFSHK